MFCFLRRLRFFRPPHVEDFQLICLHDMHVAGYVALGSWNSLLSNNYQILFLVFLEGMMLSLLVYRISEMFSHFNLVFSKKWLKPFAVYMVHIDAMHAMHILTSNVMIILHLIEWGLVVWSWYFIWLANCQHHTLSCFEVVAKFHSFVVIDLLGSGSQIFLPFSIN